MLRAMQETGQDLRQGKIASLRPVVAASATQQAGGN